MEKNIEIHHRTEGGEFIATAYHKESGRRWRLGDYKSEKTREMLAPLMLKRKSENPSEQFKSFLNGEV